VLVRQDLGRLCLAKSSRFGVRRGRNLTSDESKPAMLRKSALGWKRFTARRSVGGSAGGAGWEVLMDKHVEDVIQLLSRFRVTMLVGLG
jgi:hypothetical protein